MPTHGAETPLPLRHAIVTCRILFGCTFDEIERKTGVQSRTASKIMLRAIERAGCEDFHEVLACVGDMERSGRITRVVDGSELSATIRTAMMVHNNLQPTVAVLDQENIDIPGKKRPHRSLIQRLQHQHESEFEGRKIGDLVRVVQPTKPRLSGVDEKDRKEFCDWAMVKLDEGAIFICSDESWHEIGGPVRQKPRITKPKAEDPHQWAKAQSKVQFSVMQWAAMSTEPVMGPEYVWEAENAKERDAVDEKLIEENASQLKSVEEQRERALRPGTEEYKHMEVRQNKLYTFISSD